MKKKLIFTFEYFTQSKLANNTQEKTPAKVQNNFNTNKLNYKIMKTIEEISLVENATRTTFKVYMYEEETVRKIKVPAEIGEITLHMGYKYVDTKVKVTKYALHQEFEKDGNYTDRLVCETEMYAPILTILKGIMLEYIRKINKLQTPVI